MKGPRGTNSQKPLIPVGLKGHRREWTLEPRERLLEGDLSPGAVVLGRGMQSVSNCIVAERIESKSFLPSFSTFLLLPPLGNPSRSQKARSLVDAAHKIHAQGKSRVENGGD